MLRRRIAKSIIWLDSVAKIRLLATLKEHPCDRFESERSSLAPLPSPYGGSAYVRFKIRQLFPFPSSQSSIRYSIFGARGRKLFTAELRLANAAREEKITIVLVA